MHLKVQTHLNAGTTEALGLQDQTVKKNSGLAEIHHGEVGN